MTLFHGTTKTNYTEIVKTNILNCPVYLTPNKETAEDYAANNSCDYVVIEINVAEDILCADHEFCKEDFTVSTSLENGSVYVDGNVDISECSVTFYEEYEEVGA